MSIKYIWLWRARVAMKNNDQNSPWFKYLKLLKDEGVDMTPKEAYECARCMVLPEITHSMSNAGDTREVEPYSEWNSDFSDYTLESLLTLSNKLIYCDCNPLTETCTARNIVNGLASLFGFLDTK